MFRVLDRAQYNAEVIGQPRGGTLCVVGCACGVIGIVDASWRLITEYSTLFAFPAQSRNTFRFTAQSIMMTIDVSLNSYIGTA